MLSVRLFGNPEIEIEHEGRSEIVHIPLRGKILIGYLISLRRPCNRHEAAHLLWGSHPQASARNNLRQLLHRIKEILPNCIQWDNDQLLWAPASPWTCDLREYELALNHARQELSITEGAGRSMVSSDDAGETTPLELSAETLRALRAAVRLYTDDLLVGLQLEASPPYEEWVHLKRAELQHSLLWAVFVLTRHSLTMRDYALGIAILRRAISIAPWHEMSHRQLMRLLALSGQRKAALEQYLICARILERELGVRPSVSTEVLYEELMMAEHSAEMVLQPRHAPTDDIIIPDEAAATPTQLHVPPHPSEMIPRPALWNKLDASRTTPLTLIVAPPGYGKTTSVSAWVARRRAMKESVGTRYCWYSIDAMDDQLHRFCSQLIAAVQLDAPGACRATQQMLNGTLPLAPEPLAMQFLQDVARPGRRIVLILDDFHHIQAPEIHTFVRRLASQAPASLRLMILSRHSLPFSIARMRSLGQIIEIGMADLQMNAAESHDLLATLLHTAGGAVSLNASATAALQQLAEGWCAGIVLLALSLRNQPDPAQGLAKLLRKPHHLLASYFMDEVLAHQPQRIQHFLLYSSLLAVLEADLCAAALDGVTDGQSRAIFDAVVDNQLFVIPLDIWQGSYRYHDLFRSMLQERLLQSPLAAARTEILLRAARWYAEKGEVERAIDYALAADATEQAAALLVEHIPDLQAREQWHLLERYLAMLSAALVESTPALLLARGWLHQFFMQPPQLRAVVEKATALLSDPALRLGADQAKQLRAELTVLSIMPMIFDGDLADCERRIAEALQLLPASRHFARGNAYYYLARHRHRHGALKEALALLDHATTISAPHDYFFLIRLLHGRSLILLLEGSMQLALHSADLCLRIARQANLPISISFANMTAAIALYFRREDDRAIPLCRAVLNRPYASIQSNLVSTAFALIRMLGDADDYAGAAQVAADFYTLALGIGDGVALAMAQMLEAESAIVSGRPAEASSWLTAFDPATVHPDRAYPGWVWGMGLLRLGRPSDLSRARAGMTAMIERCQASNVHLWEVEFLVLLARICAAQGDFAVGLVAFEAALRVGFERGCVRSLLDDDSALDCYLDTLVQCAATRQIACTVQRRRAVLSSSASLQT